MGWSIYPFAHCPCCGAAVDPRLLAFSRDVQPALIPIIQHDTPGWRPAQGICPRCLLDAVSRLQGKRSANRNGFLSDTAEPFGDPSLPE